MELPNNTAVVEKVKESQATYSTTAKMAGRALACIMYNYSESKRAVEVADVVPQNFTNHLLLICGFSARKNFHFGVNDLSNQTTSATTESLCSCSTYYIGKKLQCQLMPHNTDVDQPAFNDLWNLISYPYREGSVLFWEYSVQARGLTSVYRKVKIHQPKLEWPSYCRSLGYQWGSNYCRFR